MTNYQNKFFFKSVSIAIIYNLTVLYFQIISMCILISRDLYAQKAEIMVYMFMYTATKVSGLKIEGDNGLFIVIVSKVLQ